MTKKLIIKQVGLLGRTGIHAAIAPTKHPAPSPGTNLGYPRLMNIDQCTGSDHITYNIIKHWTVVSGVFDPLSLRSSILKRLNGNDAEITQPGLSLDINKLYHINLTGAGIISFQTDGGCLWSSGALGDSEFIDSTTVTVQFTTIAPIGINILSDSNSTDISAISLKEVDGDGTELLSNPGFSDYYEHFYDVEGWYRAVDSGDTIDIDALGWLAGYNDHNIYTIFE